MTIEELLALAHSQDVEFVDLRYAFFPGRWQHHTITLSELERHFQTGHPIVPGGPGDQPAHALQPDPQTAVVDPFCQHPTMAVVCDLLDVHTRQAHPADLRGVARRTAAVLQGDHAADQAALGAVVECYVFDQVSFEQSSHTAGYRVDCREGAWRRGRDEPDNLGTQLPPRCGEGCLPPGDTLHNLRGEMTAALLAGGVPAVGHYHAAGAGQIGFELSLTSLLEAADQLMQTRYILRNAAARQGKVATFMPKPLAGDAGSRMVLRLSMSRGGVPLFATDSAGRFSEWGRHAVGGLLTHAGGLSALLRPTTNSYRGGPEEEDSRRLVTAVLSDGVLEIAGADPTCQPYLAYSAVVLAALDGIERRLEPSVPIENPVPLVAAFAGEVDDLETALHALQEDHEYLLRGAAWTDELVHRWIEYKLEHEVRPLRRYPHPYEFSLYFGVC